MEESSQSKIHYIHVRIEPQILELHRGEDVGILSFPVSTALAGAGQKNGSFQTPLGRHLVKEKIGYQLDKNTVFSARKPEKELFSESAYQQHPERDWILSRIMWLSGCEPGFNRLSDVDTKNRFIYIHGTPPQEGIGVPKSHGCIRMLQDDVIKLFDLVPIYTQVIITQK